METTTRIFCPERSATGFINWSESPLDDLKAALDRVNGQEKMYISIECDIFAAAKVLGLKVPMHREQGEVEISPGVPVCYTWESIDGRATEYITLVGGLNAAGLVDFTARFLAVTKFKVKKMSHFHVILT